MINYLIIGNGVAGATAAEFIRKQDAKGKITIVTEEALPFYYRIRLNEYISADISEQTLVANKEHWFKDNDIDYLNKKLLESMQYYGLNKKDA